jgi:hypothetical protein
MRIGNFERAGFMNHPRPRPDATAPPESLSAANSRETTHITAMGPGISTK